MTILKIRNNGESHVRFPAIADPSGRIEGPADDLDMPPGTVTKIDSERLALYMGNPAIRELFKDRGPGLKPTLEEMRADAPLVTQADLVAQYDAENAGKTIAPPAVSVNGGHQSLNSNGAPPAKRVELPPAPAEGAAGVATTTAAAIVG